MSTIALHLIKELGIIVLATPTYTRWILLPAHDKLRERCLIKHLILRIFGIEFFFSLAGVLTFCLIQVLTTCSFKEPLAHWFTACIQNPCFTRLLLQFYQEAFIDVEIRLLDSRLCIGKSRNLWHDLGQIILILDH